MASYVGGVDLPRMGYAAARTLFHSPVEEVRHTLGSRIHLRYMAYCWNMWSHRNDALHQQEKGVNRMMEIGMNQTIKQLYTKAKRLLLHTPDCYLMTKCLQVLLKQKYEYRQEWIKAVLQIAIIAQKGKLGSVSRSACSQSWLL